MTDDLTRRAIIAAHNAQCTCQSADEHDDYAEYRGLTVAERAIVEAWRAEREDLLKGAVANALTRKRLARAETDLLNVRGMLSPNGEPRRVPDHIDLSTAVAPAVEWLLAEVQAWRDRTDYWKKRAENAWEREDEQAHHLLNVHQRAETAEDTLRNVRVAANWHLGHEDPAGDPLAKKILAILDKDGGH